MTEETFVRTCNLRPKPSRFRTAGGTGGPGLTYTIGSVLGANDAWRAPIGGTMHVNINVPAGYSITSCVFTAPVSHMVKSYTFKCSPSDGTSESNRVMMARADMSTPDGTISWNWDHVPTGQLTPYSMGVDVTVSDGTNSYQYTASWTVATINPALVANTSQINSVRFQVSPWYNQSSSVVGFFQWSCNDEPAPLYWPSNFATVKNVDPGEWGGQFGVVDTCAYSITWNGTNWLSRTASGTTDKQLANGTPNRSMTTPYLNDYTVTLAAGDSTTLPTVPGLTDPVDGEAGVRVGTTVVMGADDSVAAGILSFSFSQTHKWMIVYQAVYGGSQPMGMPVSVADLIYTRAGSAVAQGGSWTTSGMSAGLAPAINVETGLVDFTDDFRHAVAQYSGWPTHSNGVPSLVIN